MWGYGLDGDGSGFQDFISRSVLLKMKNVTHKSCRENQNTHFKVSNFSSKIVPFMR